jgi:hypothetical protein
MFAYDTPTISHLVLVNPPFFCGEVPFCLSNMFVVACLCAFSCTVSSPRLLSQMALNLQPWPDRYSYHGLIPVKPSSFTMP